MSEQPNTPDADEQLRQELIDYDSGFDENFIPEDDAFHPAYAAAKAKGMLSGLKVGIYETASENAKLRSENRELEEEISRTQETAKIDSKTGLLNARGLEETYKKIQLRHEQHRRKDDAETVPGEPVIMFLDLDKFKSINETLGHGDADNLLNVIGQFLKASLRDKDVIARFGGDEFIVILEDTELEDALAAAERVRTSIEKIDAIDDKPVKPTASIGIGRLDISKPFNEAIESANKAMYDAKANGRNQVVQFTDNSALAE